MARLKLTPPVHLRRFRCSLCRTAIDDGAEVLTLPVKLDSRYGSAGRYCAPACRDAMHAVDSIRELRGDEIADPLLAAYRRGRGPSPALVLDAVERVYTKRDTVRAAT
jgi:hypothetical protein